MPSSTCRSRRISPTPSPFCAPIKPRALPVFCCRSTRAGSRASATAPMRAGYPGRSEGAAFKVARNGRGRAASGRAFPQPGSETSAPPNGAARCEAARGRPAPSVSVAAKALDALAGFLQHVDGGCVGDAEEGAHGEGRAMHAGNVLLLQHGQHDILVGVELASLARGFADQALTGWIDVERPLRLWTFETLGLVEHGDDEVAPLPKGFVIAGNEVLRAVERLD